MEAAVAAPMNVSSAPAVKRALKELLEGALGGVPVWRNKPSREHSLKENVYLGDVISRRADWDSFGALNPIREENYGIEMSVVVQRLGADPDDVEDRFNEIMEMIEAAIAENFTLGEEVPCEWVLLQSADTKSLTNEEGSQFAADCVISVRARLHAINH